MRVTKFVNTVFNSNTYIIDDGKLAIIIDIGDFYIVNSFLKDNDLQLEAIFLTHVHYDHFYGLPLLLKEHPLCRVYTNESGRQALSSSRINFSKYHNDPIEISGEKVELISNQEVISIADDFKIQAIFTPGHDLSCISYIINDNIFTGDSYIPNCPTITSFPRSNKKDALSSEKAIKTLISYRNLIVNPGHTIN